MLPPHEASSVSDAMATASRPAPRQSILASRRSVGSFIVNQMTISATTPSGRLM